MITLNAKVVAITQPVIPLEVATPEGVVAYCARVSNPSDQDKSLGTLLDYCIRNKHWSIFEMSSAIVEVEAPRDISRQLLRHRSFSFQEFSQRYSDQIEFTDRDFRRQDSENRQNSIDDLDKGIQTKASYDMRAIRQYAEDVYRWAISKGVAKECARVALPEGLTMSRLYVSGTLRSWLHYLEVRDDEGVTQWEHVLLARKVKEALTPHFPTIFELVNKNATKS